MEKAGVQVYSISPLLPESGKNNDHLQKYTWIIAALQWLKKAFKLRKPILVSLRSLCIFDVASTP